MKAVDFSIFRLPGVWISITGSYFVKNGLHYWNVRSIVIQKTDDDERNMNTVKYSEAKQEEETCETNQNAFETK